MTSDELFLFGLSGSNWDSICHDPDLIIRSHYIFHDQLWKGSGYDEISLCVHRTCISCATHACLHYHDPFPWTAPVTAIIFLAFGVGGLSHSIYYWVSCRQIFPLHSFHVSCIHVAIGLTPTQHLAAIISAAIISLWNLMSGFLVPKPVSILTSLSLVKIVVVMFVSN